MDCSSCSYNLLTDTVLIKDQFIFSISTALTERKMKHSNLGFNLIKIQVNITEKFQSYLLTYYALISPSTTSRQNKTEALLMNT